MALHLTPAEHDANPPETWTVTKTADRWALSMANGAVLDTFPRKKDADEAKVSGFLVGLYAKEGQWFAGKPVAGWKPHTPAPGMPVLLADTSIGRVVVSDGIIHILTLCCKASGKGSGMGVVCRACYRPVPDHHGWGALADDTTTQHHGQHVLAGMLRPSIERFSDEAAATIFASARAHAGVTA